MAYPKARQTQSSARSSLKEADSPLGSNRTKQENDKGPSEAYIQVPNNFESKKPE